jgi:AbrB family looped-hinge helix DNA binding protein
METITLSSKGQLLIPKAVRQSAHLAPGDVLSVRYVDGEIRLKPVTGVVPTSLAEVAGCLARPGQKPLGDAQTQAAIKARIKARFKVSGTAA